MQRRQFLKDTGCIAIAVSVWGNISKSGEEFAGDTPTTTDILGPFYRPGAPFRQDLNPPDFPGTILHLKGTIFKEDGKTPVKNCRIEIWQCKPDGIYDNTSDEYLYRAAQQIGADGKYHFITTQPIAYPVEPNSPNYRPAHIHMRISVAGQQDLITQVYFKGDQYLESDPSTRSPLSVNRILSVSRINDKESEIRFDLALRKEFVPDDSVFNKIAGIYKMSDQSRMEFYRDGDLLFYKTNAQIWGALAYAGDNTFTGGVNDTEAKFELLPDGKAKVQFRFSRRRETKIEGTKEFNYKE